MLCSKNPAKNPICKPGDIFLLKEGGENRYYTSHYILIMILDVWRVKTNYYRVIYQESYRVRDWRIRDICDFTERRMKKYYVGDGSYYRQIPDNKDLTFLVTYGSPLKCIQETMSIPQFRRKINRKIDTAQKMLNKWQEANDQIGHWKKVLEKEELNGKTSDS